MEQRLKAVIALVLGVDPATITDNSSPDTLPIWDSLRHMTLIMAIEDEFGIRFPDEVVSDVLSYSRILAALRQLLPATPS